MKSGENHPLRKEKTHFSYVKQLAKEYGIAITPSSAYPNLGTYIQYLSLREGLDYGKLSNELEQLQATIASQLLTTPDQQELAKLSKVARLLDRLYHTQLNPDDWAAYTASKSTISPQAFQTFFRRHRKLLRNSLTREDQTSLEQGLGALFDRLPQQEQFYELALKRDTALVDNTLQLLDEHRARAILLIAGGFHTPGLTRLLKDRQVPYIVLTGRVGEARDETLYTERLQNEVPTIPSLLEKLRAATLVPALGTNPMSEQLEVTSKDPDPFFSHNKEKGKGPSKRTFLLIAWAILQMSQLREQGWAQAEILNLFQQPPLASTYEVTASPDFQTVAVNGTTVEFGVDDQGMLIAKVAEETLPASSLASDLTVLSTTAPQESVIAKTIDETSDRLAKTSDPTVPLVGANVVLPKNWTGA